MTLQPELPSCTDTHPLQGSAQSRLIVANLWTAELGMEEDDMNDNKLARQILEPPLRKPVVRTKSATSGENNWSLSSLRIAVAAPTSLTQSRKLCTASECGPRVMALENFFSVSSSAVLSMLPTSGTIPSLPPQFLALFMYALAEQTHSDPQVSESQKGGQSFNSFGDGWEMLRLRLAAPPCQECSTQTASLWIAKPS
eukprot:968007-Amphidinium_carterae.3